MINIADQKVHEYAVGLESIGHTLRPGPRHPGGVRE